MADWHPKVGKSIVESWKFPEDVVRTLEPTEHLSEFSHEDATLVDAVHVAEALLALDGSDEESEEYAELMAEPATQRLGIKPEALLALRSAYNEKLSAVREALST